MSLVVAALLACTGPEPVAAPVDTGTPPVGVPLVRVAGGAPRNLLMISLDTVRRDHVDRYAPDGEGVMPFLSSWLEGAVSLDDHQQCSCWTFASTVCTLNGVHNEENGFLPKLSEPERAPLPDGQQTLAVQLRDAGFSTYLVSGNEWLSSVWNNAQGYDHVEPPVGGSLTFLARTGRDLVLGALDGPEPPERWFLHVHAVDPHVPYIPPASYLEGIPEVPWDVTSQPAHYEATDQWPDLTPEEKALLEANLRARYAADVRFLDDQLANLWTELQADGLLDDTLVVIWTDHGEQFWEHGHQSHAWGLAAEENDGVLAFWAPGLEPRAWDGPTHATDLVPTVLDALELDPPERTSGLVVGTAPANRARYAAVSARQGAVQAVTRGDYKLQYNWNGNLRLWKRSEDRAELHDVASSEPEQLRGLWVLLEPRVQLMQTLVPEHTVTWPDL